jgi:hypothetical protein
MMTTDTQARALLKELLDDLEEHRLDEQRRYMRELAIRECLGLCQSGRCENQRLDDPESDGYCAECLDFD